MPGETMPGGDTREWPEPIKQLIGNRIVRAVVGERESDGALTPENLMPLLV
jgi:hypothetical protein